MASPGVSGFKAKMEVDDAGTGGAAGGASTVFDGVVMINWPDLEAPTLDTTELNAADSYERERPQGTIKKGKTQAQCKYTKANYNRLKALAVRAANLEKHQFKLTSPDDNTTPGTPVLLVVQFGGQITKVSGPRYVKSDLAVIDFEVNVEDAPTFT